VAPSHWGTCYSKLVMLVTLDKPCGISTLAYMLIKINHVNQKRQTRWHFHIGTYVSKKSVMVVISNKRCGTSTLAHKLVKISHITQIKEAMWHIHIGTHVSQH